MTNLGTASSAAKSTYSRGQQAAVNHQFAAAAYAKAVKGNLDSELVKKAVILGNIAKANDLAFKPSDSEDFGEICTTHLSRAMELLERRQDNVLAKYRGGYENSTTAHGHKSKCNGDKVARALEGHTPETVMAAAEILLGMAQGELVAKYAKLNPGQRRMNSGNRIRNAVKKGIITANNIEEVIATLA